MLAATKAQSDLLKNAVAAQTAEADKAEDAKEAAITAAQQQADISVKRANTAVLASVAEAERAKQRALQGLVARSASWKSASSRNARGLAYPHAQFEVTENRQSRGPTTGGLEIAARLTLQACAARCTANAKCTMFNFADVFPLDLNAPFDAPPPAAKLGVCQLVAPKQGSGPSDIRASQLTATVAAVATFYQYHLFTKQFARGGSVDDGTLSQQCMPGVNYQVHGGEFANGACSSTSTCDGAQLPASGGGQKAGTSFFCREPCASGFYRKFPAALHCTAFRPPCNASQGWFESSAGTRASDRQCTSTFAGFADSAGDCCDASGCTKGGFLLQRTAPDTQVTATSPACVQRCPDGFYGANRLCRRCPSGCTKCTPPVRPFCSVVLQAFRPPFL